MKKQKNLPTASLRKALLPVALFLLWSCGQKPVVLPPYPVAELDTVTDNYFGVVVPDPYRWLENDTSEQSEAWIAAETALTDDYMAQIPFREKIKKRLMELYDYKDVDSTAPYQKGDFYYYYKKDKSQAYHVIYRMKTVHDSAEVFFDPNSFSDDGSIVYTSSSWSPDNKYMAYCISRGGVDAQEVFVRDLQTGKDLDHLKWVFEVGKWYKDGFYYVSYIPADTTKRYSPKSTQLRYHHIGQPQSTDQHSFISQIDFSPKREYVLYRSSPGSVLYCDSVATEKRLFAIHFKYEYKIVDLHEHHLLLLLSDSSKSTKRLISLDISHPDSVHWVNLIPEVGDTLIDVVPGSGKLLAHYRKDARSRVQQLNYYNGEMQAEIELPGVGTVYGLQGGFYNFSNYITPVCSYQYDAVFGKSNVRQPSTIPFKPEDYVQEQVFYTSSDSTRVPMFIARRKDIRLDGKAPVLLYGYGGFNISTTPFFNPSWALFLEKGGIVAVPSIRGGGEYGEAWHKAGIQKNKQNSFDDFIAAAEYLFNNKYTSSDKLAIYGVSNGGILVGAVMTQRPELFRVAIPEKGVMDLLRYQKFSHARPDEYGISDKKEDFDFLYSYSPLQNIRDSIVYPSTFVITADHDDRVPPIHSYKFAATLQAKQAGKRPVLLRVARNEGHNNGVTTSKMIDEQTDFWCFVFHELGIEY